MGKINRHNNFLTAQPKDNALQQREERGGAGRGGVRASHQSPRFDGAVIFCTQ